MGNGGHVFPMNLLTNQIRCGALLLLCVAGVWAAAGAQENEAAPAAQTSEAKTSAAKTSAAKTLAVKTSAAKTSAAKSTVSKGAPGEAADAPEPAPDKIDVHNLPTREGAPPQTTDAPAGTNVAHEQASQQAPRALQEQLYARMQRLEGIRTGPSLVSVPGARALFLAEDLARGPRDAFLVRNEFVHLHPPYDGSLHIALPGPLHTELRAKGWGEAHPRNPRISMVYGPRNAQELEVVWALVEASYRYARGEEKADEAD